MIKVSIIGSGNVAQHLISAFKAVQKAGAKLELVEVYSRKKETVTHLVEQDQITTSINDLKEADIYIIAVSDDAIASVAQQLPFKNRLVVHTSGSVSVDVIADTNRKGVFYPLQSFTKNKAVDFTTIPICLEAENATDYQLIDALAKLISPKVFAINSQQRRALHVAAVFVNNFTNHLYQIGKSICDENQIPFAILHPLINETAQKIASLTPSQAQTGPAIRQDEKTIATHQDFLSNEEHLHIYKILTQAIQNNGKEL
ncbi:Rossmann-like and DUF2520 domain-containing protein [Flavobacterium sp.]|uniref:Rossmann-like and DUF2520 domain-containing protein n=1 Tax=Flavobacterium sp. TaxID=239 RepID=UPI00262D03B9|nr:Rossmann-like and DUF2520 domain-containing protein [Flavobacterium sp.]MDG2433845.1 DUF2520 domain-containing protein [Flavobacterium sp.]